MKMYCITYMYCGEKHYSYTRANSIDEVKEKLLHVRVDPLSENSATYAPEYVSIELVD